MVFTRFRYLFLFAILLGFAACNSNISKENTDDSYPIFKKEPLLKEITEQIKKNPGDASLVYQRGNILKKLNQDSLALRDYIKATTLDTGRAAYYSAVGDLLFEQKDIAGSVPWIEKAINRNPNDPGARLKIAKMFLYLQQHGKAIGQINLVLRKQVYNPEAYFLKGMVYKDMKDTAKAISSFQTVLQVAPEYREAVIQLGLIYSAKNDPLAIRYLENANKMDSNDAFPIFARGVYYQKHNDIAKAKEAYHKCLIKDRHYIDAYFNLGSIYMQEDSIDKSFRQYDLITKLQPDNPTGFYDRGVCYEMLNKMKEAVLDYKRATLLDTAYQNPKKALLRLGVK